MYTCICVDVYMRTCVYVYVCMYMYMHSNMHMHIYLREVGALPEDSSRGVGAVEVPEKRRAGSRYLGRLGGDLIFLVILVL